MDKLTEFYDRRINVLDLGNGLTLGRESANNMDYMIITCGQEILYAWWHNPNKKVTNKPPKHTGGKPPYIKIMLKAVQEHKGLSLNASGFFIKIANNIQWTDNLVIDMRSKKALSVEGITTILGIKKTLTYDTIKELREADLLIKDKDGYRISTCLIQKGGGKK